jgi:hypothetical protein
MPAPDVTLTIAPGAPASTTTWAKAWQTLMVPSTLTSKTRRTSAASTSTSSTVPTPRIPAELTRPCGVPNRATAARTSSTVAPRSVTSVGMQSNRSLPGNSASSSFSCASDWSAATTAAPSPCSAATQAAPMPLAAPVTKIVRPSKRLIPQPSLLGIPVIVAWVNGQPRP